MADLTMGAATQIGDLEYQAFASWYTSIYGKNPPPNDDKLAKDKVYLHWKDYIRPGVWSPSMETQSAQGAFANVPPEVQTAFNNWFTSTYGRAPYGAATQLGNIWFQNWQGRAANAPGAPNVGTPPNQADNPMGNPQVVSIGGYDFMPTMDLNGNIVGWEVIGKTETNELTPYQEWQIKNTEADRAQQLRIAQEQTKEAQAGLMAQRIAAVTASRKGGMSNQEKSRVWENAKSELMAQYSSPEDWIPRWQIQQRENPYANVEISSADRVRNWQQEFDKYRSMRQRAKEIEKEARADPNRSLTFGEKQYIDFANTAYENARENLLKAEVENERSGGWKITGSPETGYIAGGTQKKVKPATPATPDWLAKMYPELGARLPEKPSPLAPPSAQSINQLSPSQIPLWAGYAQYTGATPEDLLWQTQQMLPQPRSGMSWAPARQRVSV